MTHGRERTVAELDGLLADTGFARSRVVSPEAFAPTLLVAEPIRAAAPPRRTQRGRSGGRIGGTLAALAGLRRPAATPLERYEVPADGEDPRDPAGERRSPR